MVTKMKQLIVILFVLTGTRQLEARSANECNNCLTKSYGLSKDGSFVVDGKKFLISPNISDLSINHLKSPKCCYEVHGDDNYQLIIDQNDERTNFFIRGLGVKHGSLTVHLNDSNDKQLTFACLLSGLRVEGYFRADGKTTEITNQLLSSSASYPSHCSWSLPLVITGDFKSYNTKNGVYNLTIYENSMIVYTEANVPLKGFSVKMIPNLIMIFVPILINFLFSLI